MKGLVAQIFYGVIVSFILWGMIWLAVVGVEGEPAFEIVHVTRKFVGLGGFLDLAFASVVVTSGISLSTWILLPKMVEAFGWTGRLGWAIAGAILGELTVWAVGLLLFLIASGSSVAEGLLEEGAFVNVILWVVVAMPYGAVSALLARRNKLGATAELATG